MLRSLKYALMDPITHPIKNPVVTSDGHLYDRQSIERLINSGRSRLLFPRTNLPITNVLTPVFELRDLIRNVETDGRKVYEKDNKRLTFDDGFSRLSELRVNGRQRVFAALTS